MKQGYQIFLISLLQRMLHASLLLHLLHRRSHAACFCFCFCVCFCFCFTSVNQALPLAALLQQHRYTHSLYILADMICYYLYTKTNPSAYLNSKIIYTKISLRCCSSRGSCFNYIGVFSQLFKYSFRSFLKRLIVGSSLIVTGISFQTFTAEYR